MAETKIIIELTDGQRYAFDGESWTGDDDNVALILGAMSHSLISTVVQTPRGIAGVVVAQLGGRIITPPARSNDPLPPRALI